MRKAVKFLHTLAACGMIGALAAYVVVLLFARQATPADYAVARHTIALLCSYLLLPSMGLALITGLLSMVVHRPFQELRWVWLKALLGISTFEATLGIVNAKANTAAALADKIAAGQAKPDALSTALANEWLALYVILSLLIANVVLGVWRPTLRWG